MNPVLQWVADRLIDAAFAIDQAIADLGSDDDA